MTRAEIFAMPAGRALDALVAEKVMGWTRIVTGTWQQAGNLHGNPPGANTRRVPRYSTDIAAAWDVVDRVCALEIVDEDPFTLRRGYTSDQRRVPADKQFWAAVFQFGNDDPLTFIAPGETAALAIARAALLVACETNFLEPTT